MCALPLNLGNFALLPGIFCPKWAKLPQIHHLVITRRAVYPEDSILADWMRLAREQVESADAFIIGSILPVCAALLGRRVYFQWGEQQIFPNCFNMLAGKPGDRKSSIIDLAEMLARRIASESAFLPKSFSPETLFEEFS